MQNDPVLQPQCDPLGLLKPLLLPSAVVILVALILRTILLFQFRDLPLFDIHIMDMSYFHLLATTGIPDTGFPEGPFFKAPLYPLFLKMVYGVFGDGPWVVRIVQIVLGSLTAGLTCALGGLLFNRRTGLISGLIVAFTATLMLYDLQILVPSLAIFLNMVSLLFLTLAFQTKRNWMYLAGALVLGLSAIARPTVLVFALAVMLYMIFLHRRCEIRMVGRPLVMFLVGLAIAIAPVTIRNYVESGEFVLIGTYSGINLYIGNNLNSDGVSAVVPGTGIEWWEDASMDDTRREAEAALGRSLTAVEQSAYWRDKALGEMFDNPSFVVSNMASKFVLFLGGLELANNFDIYYLKNRLPLISRGIWKGPIFFPWALLLSVGLAGMALVRRWSHEMRLLPLFTLSSIPALLLFFVTARYRLPLIPVFAVFVAVVVDYAIDSFKSLEWKRVAVAAVVAIAALVVSHWDLRNYSESTDAQGHQMMASLYERRGNLYEAERYYRFALQEDEYLPHANNDLGLLLLQKGNVDQAIFHHERAVMFQPDDWILHYNLGVAYMTGGQYERSIPEFRIAREYAPDFYGGANNLAMVYNRLGHADSALIEYRAATQIRPDDYRGFFGLGLAHQILEQRDSALVHYHTTAGLAPEYTNTYFNLGRLWLEESNADSCRFYLEKFLSASPIDPGLEAQATEILQSLE